MPAQFTAILDLLALHTTVSAAQDALDAVPYDQSELSDPITLAIATRSNYFRMLADTRKDIEETIGKLLAQPFAVEEFAKLVNERGARLVQVQDLTAKLAEAEKTIERLKQNVSPDIKLVRIASFAAEQKISAIKLVRTFAFLPDGSMLSLRLAKMAVEEMLYFPVIAHRLPYMRSHARSVSSELSEWTDSGEPPYMATIASRKDQP